MRRPATWATESIRGKGSVTSRWVARSTMFVQLATGPGPPTLFGTHRLSSPVTNLDRERTALVAHVVAIPERQTGHLNFS